MKRNQKVDGFVLYERRKQGSESHKGLEYLRSCNAFRSFCHNGKKELHKTCNCSAGIIMKMRRFFVNTSVPFPLTAFGAFVRNFFHRFIERP